LTRLDLTLIGTPPDGFQVEGALQASKTIMRLGKD
jgi:hypothetical protein